MMDTIWKKAATGGNTVTDLERGNLTVNGQKAVTGGTPLLPTGIRTMPHEAALRALRHLYSLYRNSVPNWKSRTQTSRYFTALPETDLDAESLVFGQPRKKAKTRLETFILICKVNGSLDKERLFPEGRWFYQDTENKDIILLKSWF